VRKSNLSLWGVLCLAPLVVFNGRMSAADEPDDELVQMVVDLVSDKDADMRAVGLQQVREGAKGTATTKRFAALLPKLSPEAQAGLLVALGQRGDDAARPAVLEMLQSPREPVRVAALRALGLLGKATDVPLLVELLTTTAGPEKATALASLAQLNGATINAAVVAELKRAKPKTRVELFRVLANRNATDSAEGILPLVDDANVEVRKAAMAVLGQLAAPEHVPDMLRGVLKAERGREREAAEKAVMFVCQRIKDTDKRADPLLAAFAQRSKSEKTVLLPTLGRIGGCKALKVVEAAIAEKNPKRHEAGVRALCNWPDASVVAKLIELSQTDAKASHRIQALRAMIRVAALRDGRSDVERLNLLKKAMTMATRDRERNLVLKRVRAIRTIESLRFVVPYLDNPTFAQGACATVVELAHHKGLREPNKAEFDEALDVVIHTSKDPKVVDRAKRYQKGQT